MNTASSSGTYGKNTNTNAASWGDEYPQDGVNQGQKASHILSRNHLVAIELPSLCASTPFAVIG
jgi:hypothetical protein